MPTIPDKSYQQVRPDKRKTVRLTPKDPRYELKEWRDYSFELRATTGKCQQSGREYLAKYLVVDHIIPVSEGGSFWDKRNHQVLYFRTHNSKSMSEKHGCKTKFKLNENGEKIPA